MIALRSTIGLISAGALLACWPSRAVAERFQPTIDLNRGLEFTDLAASGGLTRRNILDLDFEPDGTAWLAASDGLHRYDGYSWQRFTVEHGLPSNFVRSVLVAQDGRIWAGSDRGVAVGRGDAFQAVPEDELAGPSVRRIVEDPNGGIWFCSDHWPDGTVGGGLTHFHEGSWTAYRAPGEIPDDYVVNYFLDSDGRRYLVTRSGPAVWDQDHWRALEIPDAAGEEWQSAEFAEGPQGRVFLNAGGRVFLFRAGRLEQTAPTGARLQYGITATGDGEVFAFSRTPQGNLAMQRWSGTEFQAKPGALEAPLSQLVERIVEAPDGSIWAAGFGYLLRWARRASEWFSYDDLPPPAAIDGRGRVWFVRGGRAVRMDGDDWERFEFPFESVIPTHDGGVLAASPSRIAHWTDGPGESFDAGELGLRRIGRADVDATGTWWVSGTDANGRFGASFFDGSRWRRAELPAFTGVERVDDARDPVEGIWYLCHLEQAGEARLIHARTDDDAGEWDAIPLAESTLFAPTLYVDRLSRVWIFGAAGLHRWDPANRTLLPETLPVEARLIVSMAEVGDSLWLAASGRFGGDSSLLRYRDGRWAAFEAGLGGTSVSGRVQSSDGQIFFAGRDALYHLTPRSEVPVEVPVPTTNQVRSALLDAAGALWVGTESGGLRRRSRGEPPQTTVESDLATVRIGETKRIRARGSARFDPQGRWARFTYSWRLNGGDWSPFRPNSVFEASTAELGLGLHRIEVRAQDQDLDVDPTPAELTFEVTAIPLQERPWFAPAVIMTLLALLGLPAFALVGRRSIARGNIALREANRELDARRSEQLAAERQRAEAALEQEHRLLRAVMESVPDYVFVKDLEGRFLAANTAHARDLGLDDPAEMLGKTDFDYYPSDLAELYQADDQQVLRSGSPLLNRKEPTAASGGRRRWSLTAKVPFYGEDGAALGIVGVARDITELHEAEMALRESEIRMRALLEQAPVTTWTVDRELRFTSVHGSLYDQAVQDGRILGETLQQRLGTDSEEHVAIRSHRKALSGEPALYEMESDGRIYDVRLTTLLDPAGGIAGCIGVAVDVTERKLTEQQKRQLEKQVRQSQKMEAVGVFAEGIAHDFNNLLTSTKGFATLAQQEAPTGSLLRSYIDEVLVSSERARELVAQIFAFGRRDEGRPGAAEVRATVEEAVRLLRAMAPSSTEINCRIEIESAHVSLSAGELHRVLTNLCTNAYQAFGDRGGVIDVEVRQARGDESPASGLPAEDYIEICVRDDGPGMAPSVVERVFEPFFTTKEMGRGTGLGLSVVHGIVTRAAGTIRIESAPGKGSCFIILLPRQEPESGAAAGDAPAVTSGRERILFVDDENAIVRLVTSAMNRFGYRVYTASSGQEALSRFSADPDGFDLLISDVTMPKMSGVDLAKQVRRLRSDLPVILCTGYDVTPAFSIPTELGALRLIQKPFGMDQLAQEIRLALDEVAKGGGKGPSSAS